MKTKTSLRQALKYVLFLHAILFIYTANCQTNVRGTISTNTTWTKVGSPYNFTGHVTINGALLSIEAGVIINQGSYSLNINANSSGNSSRPAHIYATGVTFRSTGNLNAALNFNGHFYNNIQYLAGGTISQCTFENMVIRFDDNSTPTISNSTITFTGNSGTAFQATNGAMPVISGNTISGYAYPLSLANESKPDFKQNNINGCLNQIVALSGNYTNNFTLPDYSFPYILTSNITITGATFTIPTGMTINTGTYNFNVNAFSSSANSRPASLNATRVTFRGTGNLTSQINFNGHFYNNIQYSAGGTISQCIFENIVIRFDDNSTPTISNSTITFTGNSGTALQATNGAMPKISGNTISGYAYPLSIANESKPVFLQNNISECLSQTVVFSGSYASNYTVPDYGLAYTLASNITITGATFTIPDGMTINTGSYNFNVNAYASSANSRPAYLNASRVTFRGTGILTSQLNFNGHIHNTIQYPAGGTISQCIFENMIIRFDDNSIPVISNSTITFSGSSGTALQANNGAEPVITGNTISGFLYALSIANESKPVFSRNDISGCLSQTVVFSGSYASNYTVPDYGLAYTLASNITITGATFTIPSGMVINTGTYNIIVNAFVSSANSRPAYLNATKVTFRGTGNLASQIYYNGHFHNNLQYPSGGTLSQCTLENITIRIDDNSTPTISNSNITFTGNSGTAFQATNGAEPVITGNTISGYLYPLSVANEARPTFNNNNSSGCLSHSIGLSGTFATNYALPDYGYDYTLTGTLTISGAEMNLPAGIKVFMGSSVINVNSFASGANSRPAKLNGINIHFQSSNSSGPNINFSGNIANNITYSSGGLLNGCTFENVTLRFNAYSAPTITKSKIFNSKLGVYCATGSNPVLQENDFYNNTTTLQNASTQTIDAQNNFWGHQSGPKHTNNTEGLGELITGNVNYTPYRKTPINGNIEPSLKEQLLTFDPVPVGSHQDRVIHLINKGDIHLKITGITTETNSFRATGNFPVWVKKDDTVKVTIRFAPPHDGIIQDNLVIATNILTKETMLLPVSGEGTKVINVFAENLHFGDVYIRTTKKLDFQIKNVGPTRMLIDSLVAPDAAYRFETSQSNILKSLKIDENLHYDETDTSAVLKSANSETSVLGFWLNPGEVFNISLNFRPLEHKNYDGTLRIHYNTTGLEPLLLKGSGYADPLSVEISSFDFKNFPFIYMNVQVESFGKGIETLGKSNFRIWEDNVQQTNNYVVTPPGEHGGSRLADIIFIMDNSGSMSDEQAQVRNNVFNFVNGLAGSGVNFALGLCRYGADRPNLILEDNGNLTTDVEYFKNSVWTRNVIDGGHEPGYEAIVYSSSNFAFRPGSQKIFIIITDETPAQGSVTLQQALTACLDNSITLFALTSRNLFNAFTQLTVETNGEVYDITQPFDKIFEYITNIVSSTYLLQYSSSHQTETDRERVVFIEVKYNGYTARDTIRYTPGTLPKITRTEATLFLHTQGWGLGTALNIEAYVTDNVEPFVNSVKLFYRTTGQTDYASINMTRSVGDTYKAFIPGNFVNAPGVDYYIQATDGSNTVTDPTVEPEKNPHQISILPNKAPEIIFTPVYQYGIDQPVEISAVITDNTNRLTGTFLYYRLQGQLIYTEVQLQNVGNDIFKAVIPANFINNQIVEYYLRAIDDFGISNYAGWPDNPFVLDHASRYPSASLSLQKIKPGQSLIVTGSNFVPFGEVDIQFTGVSDITRIDGLKAGVNGSFKYTYPGTSGLLPGNYYMVLSDITTGREVWVPFIVESDIIPTSYPRFLAPMPFGNYYAGEPVTLSWEDKKNFLYEPQMYMYKYKIEYIKNNGIAENIQTLEYFAYTQTTTQRNIQFVPETSGKYRFRITDLFSPDRTALSDEIEVKSPIASGLAVNFRWDNSFSVKPPLVPIGVAADGVARIYMVVNYSRDDGRWISSVNVTLSEPKTVTMRYLGSVQYSGIQNDHKFIDESSKPRDISAANYSTNFDGKYLFWYYAPDDFARGPEDFNSRERIVNATFVATLNDGTKESIVKEIKIVRPPLMLVHGLNGSYNTWDDFPTENNKELFIYDNRFIIRRAVSMLPVAAFVDNTARLLDQNINNKNSFSGMIHDMRSAGFASNQVDYICHSMGGAMFRDAVNNAKSFFRYNNYNAGFVNKFISLNTPHNGSSLANLLVDIDKSVLHTKIEYLLGGLANLFECDFWGCIAVPAVYDLRYKGGIKFNTVAIPSHLIGSGVPCMQFNLKTTGIYQLLTFMATGTLLPSCAVLDTYFMLKGYESNFINASDAIVSLKSQFSLIDYNVPPNNITRVYDLMHNSDFGKSPTASTEVGSLVSRLLNMNSDAPVFGSIPETHVSEKKAQLPEQQVALKVTTDRIRIVQPADSSEFRPGDIISIELMVDTAGLQFFFLNFQGQTIMEKPTTTSPVYKFTINGQYIEEQNITTLGGYLNNGEQIMSSASATIMVTPPDKPKEFMVSPDYLVIEKTKSRRPDYSAIFEKYISKIGQTKLITAEVADPDIAEYDPTTNSFTGKNAGITYARITYRELTVAIVIEVTEYKEPPIDPPTGLNDVPVNKRKLFNLKAYPNPFNDKITFEYRLATEGNVRVDIYTMLGQKVYSGIKGIQYPGLQHWETDLSGLPSGVYFYRFTAGEEYSYGNVVKR